MSGWFGGGLGMGGPGGLYPPGGGSAGGGDATSFSASLAAAAPVLGNLTQSAQFLGRAFEALGNASMTWQQQLRSIAEELPVIGQFLKAAYSMTDAMTGVTEQFRKSAEDLQRASVVIAATGNAVRQQMGVNIERAGAVGLSQDLRMMGPQSAIRGDRTTLAGQREYERQRMLAPLELQQRLAQGGVTGARMAAIQAAEEGRRATAGVAAARANRDRLAQIVVQAEGGKFTTSGQNVQASLMFGAGGPLLMGNDPKRGAVAEQRGKLAEADLQLQEAIKTQQQAINQSKERGAALAQREADLRRQGIALAQAELSLAEQKETRLKNQLQTLGQMSLGDRAAAIHGVRAVEEMGWDRAGPWAQQMARQVNPERAAQLARQAAERSGALDQLPAGWREAGGRMVDVEQEVAQREAKVRQLVMENEQKMAGDMRVVMDGFADKIGAAILSAVRAAEDRIENMIKMGHNAQR